MEIENILVETYDVEKITKFSVYWQIVKITLLMLLFLVLTLLLLSKFNRDLGIIIAYIMILMWVFIKKKNWIKELLISPSKKIDKKDLNITLLLFSFAPLIIAFLFMYFDKKGYDKGIAEYTLNFASNVSILSVILIVVMAPICEEIFFRGFIFSKLKTVHKPITAIIVSSLIFSLIHGTLIQQTTVWIMGIVFSYFYYKTGNIRLSILGHFLNNLIGCIPLVLYKFKIDGYSTPRGLIFDSILQFVVYYIVFHKLNNRIPEIEKMDI